MSMEARYVDETVVRMAELMTPALENFSGHVHGGAILALLDRAAYVCSCKFAGCYCVTVAVDWVEFRAPVRVGELLILTSRVVHVGTSSMTVEIEVESQDIPTGECRRTNICTFTMVAVRDGVKVSVPRLLSRTPEDDARLRSAGLHRAVREEYRRRHEQIPDPPA